MSLPRDYWRRDTPGFYNFLALERAPLRDPVPLQGLRGALMSKDEATGAQTFIVEFPAGWRSQHDATGATLELFLLRGEVALEGETVGASGYVQLAQGCGGGELRSERGGLALAFWNPNMPAFPPPYTRNRTLRLWQQPWRSSLPDAHGEMYKSLRLPEPSGDGYEGGPGGYLQISYMPPGLSSPFQHLHHECFEEIFLLQGDCLLADEGVMGIGSAACHPQEWWHGPFASRSGAVMLVHTDAPMGIPWPPRDYPFQTEIIERYLDTAPWDVPTEHAEWAALDLRDFQSLPEYEAWRSAPEWEEYGSDAGRGSAAAFRAAWTFRQSK